MKNKENKLVKVVIGTAVLGTGLACAVGLFGERTKEVLANGKIMRVPKAECLNIGPNMCAGYARLASEEIFGNTFPIKDAWNIRYANEVITNFNELDLNAMVEEGIAQEGFLIGMYNSNSLHNLERDETGESVKYTHIGVYLGTNYEGKALVAHQFGSKTYVENQEKLKEKGLSVRELIRIKR